MRHQLFVAPVQQGSLCLLRSAGTARLHRFGEQAHQPVQMPQHGAMVRLHRLQCRCLGGGILGSPGFGVHSLLPSTWVAWRLVVRRDQRRSLMAQ